MAYLVLSGALDFLEAAGVLALGAIAAGELDGLTTSQFHALCGRLETTLVKASTEIEQRAADRIRRAIAPFIERKCSREAILLVAADENIAPKPAGMSRVLPTLPRKTIEEICRQEVRKALAAEKQSGRTAHG